MKITLQKIFGNSVWLIFDKIFKISLKLVVSILLANYLGAEKFGELNYALSIVAIFFSFSSLGLNGIVVNEFVNNPNQRSVTISNSLLLRFSAGILSFISVFILANILEFDDTTVFLIRIFCIGYLFKSFEIIDYWFQSILAGKISTTSRAVSMTIISLLQILAIYQNWSIQVICVIIATENILIALLYTIFYLKGSTFTFKFDYKIAKSLLRKSWPLILSSVGSIIYLKIDQIMIEYFFNNKLVGVYSVAVQYSEIWYFVPIAIASSFFPMLINEKGNKRLDTLMKGCYSIMFLLSFSIALSMTFIGPIVIKILYKKEFWPAGNILVIHIWAGVFIFMRSIFSKWLIIKEKFIYSIHTHLSGAFVNVILNIFLIPKYGLSGAAISTVISYAFSSYISLWIFPSLRPAARQMTESIVRPIYYFKLLVSNEK